MARASTVCSETEHRGITQCATVFFRQGNLDEERATGLKTEDVARTFSGLQHGGEREARTELYFNTAKEHWRIQRHDVP